jgi:hypothetical protein
MESVTSVLAERTNEAEHSCHPQELHSSSKHTTPTRTLRRRRSIFSLAGSIFKSHVSKDDPDHPGKQQSSPPVKGSWNPFASLRGSKESKKKSTNFATTRCKSSSPQKDDTSSTAHLFCSMNRTNFSVFDEFGRRKTMKRKSLQDLLGTMSIKFSRGRRQVVEEAINPTYEGRGEECESPSNVSPLILPDSSIPAPLRRGEVLGSLDSFQGKTMMLMQGLGDLTLGVESPKSHWVLISPDRIATFSDRSTAEENEEQTNIDIPMLAENTGVSQTDRDVQTPKSSEGLRSSGLHHQFHDSIQISATPSPEKLCPIESVDFLRDVSPQIQKHVTLVKNSQC